jgi:hypothetical protein
MLTQTYETSLKPLSLTLAMYNAKNARIKRARTNFRMEFPQLCEPAQLPAPLDFSIIKDIEEPVKVVESSLPPGWIDLRTYRPPEIPPEIQVNSHELMCKCVAKMRKNWERWDREHDMYVDYDYYEDGLVDYETEPETEDSVSAEDPDEYEEDQYW